MDNDRYYVLGQMVEAVALLTASPKAHTLLPEIRSNLVMATKDAITVPQSLRIKSAYL